MHTLHNRHLKKFEWMKFMGWFSEALELLITPPKNDRTSIVSSTFSLWEKSYRKTCPHCHNAKTFNSENRPHCHKFGRVSVLFIFMGNLWRYGSMETLTAINSEECRYLSSLWEIYGVMAVGKA